MKVRVCVRCGSDKKIEAHHIIHKINSGRDTKDNLVDLCKHCHIYQHQKEKLLNTLILWFNEMRQVNRPKRLSGIKARVDLTIKRLEVMETENTPMLIRQRGYYTYWNDENTHNANGGE